GEVERLAEKGSLVPHQMDHFLEVRRKGLEFALRAGLEPARFGARGGLREARNERRGGRDRVIALPAHLVQVGDLPVLEPLGVRLGDRKSTRLNSSHLGISYAVFCLKK